MACPGGSIWGEGGAQRGGHKRQRCGEASARPNQLEAIWRVRGARKGKIEPALRGSHEDNGIGLGAESGHRNGQRTGQMKV
jgi:hypothetical protein